MNRAAVAKDLLFKNMGRRVTLRMLQEAGLEFYTARNAVAEAKATLDLKVYSLRHVYHKNGEQVADNGWILEPILGAADHIGRQADGEPLPHPPAPALFDKDGQGEIGFQGMGI